MLGFMFCYSFFVHKHRLACRIKGMLCVSAQASVQFARQLLPVCSSLCVQVGCHCGCRQMVGAGRKLARWIRHTSLRASIIQLGREAFSVF